MDIHKLPIRLIMSVIAGIAVSKILSVLTHEILHLMGILPALSMPMFDDEPIIISLVYHCVYAVVGAYITAYIAREGAMKAVFILGTKEAILWLLGVVLLWKHSAPWFNISKALLGIPLALLGGKIYIWHKNRTEKKSISKNLGCKY